MKNEKTPANVIHMSLSGAIWTALAGASIVRSWALIKQVAQYIEHRFFLLIRVAVLIVVYLVLGMTAIALLVIAVLSGLRRRHLLAIAPLLDRKSVV